MGNSICRCKGKDGSLVLITSAPPLAASKGEGKTSCALALLDALRMVGVNACAVLRQPSLGISAAGAKGGASGSGKARLKEAEKADFGLNGEMLRVGAYQNLLVSLAEKFIGQNGKILLPRSISVPTRYLRNVGAGGFAEKFVLTPASEVEQIRTLSLSREELFSSIKGITVGKKNGRFVTAKSLPLASSWPILFPSCRISLLRTVRNSPVFMYCGPFANVSLGIPGLKAVKMALEKYELVLVEAGYGFDMGMQKYLEAAGRRGAPKPVAAIVVTRKESLEKMRWRHVQAMKCIKGLGLTAIPLLNIFNGEWDSWAKGSIALNPVEDGREKLQKTASALMRILQAAKNSCGIKYKWNLRLVPKMRYVCLSFYGVPPSRVIFSKGFKKSYLSACSQAKLEGLSLSDFSLNVVKSPSSLTDDDHKKFSKRSVTVRGVSLNTGSRLINVRATLSLTTSLPKIA